MGLSGYLDRLIGGLFFIMDYNTLLKKYPGYTGWGQTEALADFGATGGTGKEGSTRVSTTPTVDPAVAAREQQRILDQKLAKQKAEEQDFMGRFRSAIEGLEPLSEIRQRVIGENFPQYEGLREGAFEAGETLRNIPSDVRSRANQVGMSANRINARIQNRIQKLQPFVQDTLSKLSFYEDQIGQAMQLEAADRQNALIPLQQEAALLSDRLNREITGYTQQMQNQTQLLLQKLANQGALDVQELKNLSDAAIAEQQYFDSEIVTVGGRKKLVNKRTGEVISDLGPSTTGGGSSNIQDYLPSTRVKTSGTTQTQPTPGFRPLGELSGGSGGFSSGLGIPGVIYEPLQ